jgi:hypothetical protein
VSGRTIARRGSAKGYALVAADGTMDATRSKGGPPGSPGGVHFLPWRDGCLWFPVVILAPAQ